MTINPQPNNILILIISFIYRNLERIEFIEISRIVDVNQLSLKLKCD